MANITRIIKVQVDTETGDVTLLKNELKGVEVELKNVNKQQQATNQLQSKATQLIDKFTGGLATSVKGWYDTAKAAKAALSGIRTGLLATGIGALVVALGTIVAYWDEISVAIGIANRASAKFLATSQAITTEAQKRYDLAVLEGKIAEKAATTEEERFEQEKIRLQSLLMAQKTALAEAQFAQKQMQREIADQAKTFRMLGGARSLIGLTYLAAVQITDEEKKEIADAVEDAKLEIKQTEAALNQLIISYQRFEDSQKEKEKEKDPLEGFAKRLKEAEKEAARWEYEQGLIIEEEMQAEIDRDLAAKKRRDQEAQDFDDFAKRQLNATMALNEALLRSEEAKAKKQKEIERKVLQNKLKLAQEGFNAAIMFNEALLGNSEKNAKMAFEIDKALRIGSAVMGTAQAVVSALSQTTDITPTQSLRTANAIMAGVMGAAQVAVIAAQRFTPTGGDGGAIGMAGRFNAPSPNQPQFNTVGGTDINQLSASIAAKNNQPVQAYVVAQDVSTAQALERNRTQQASFP
jgi:hypothetical protein